MLHAQFLHFIKDINKLHYNPHLSIALDHVVEEIIIPLDSFVGNFKYEGPCIVEFLHSFKDFNDGSRRLEKLKYSNGPPVVVIM